MITNNSPILLTCPTCNAPLDFDGLHTVIRCKFCGNISVVPASLVNPESDSHYAWDEICRLVNNGNLDIATDRFQTTFSADVNESKEAVKAIEDGRLVMHAATEKHSARELFEIMQKIQRLASSGRKEEATMLYQDNFDLTRDQIENAINLIANSGANISSQVYFDSQGSSLRTQKRNGGVFVGILLFLVFFIVIIFFFINGAISGQYISMQPDILVPSADGTNQYIAGTFYDVTSENYLVGLVDTTSGKMLWKSDPLDEIGTFVASGSDLVFASSSLNLLAYSFLDGSLVWQTEMSDSLGYGDIPMLFTSGRLITFTADQIITAYDASSGSKIWSREFSAYDSTLRLMGDVLVVKDYLAGTYDTSLFFINPVTGVEQQVITPTCLVNDYHDQMDSDTKIVFDKEENSLFLVFDSGCVQRFDLASKSLVWNTTDQNTFSNIYQGFIPLLTDTDLYFGNAGDIVKINKFTGVEKILISDEDFNLLPLAQAGDNLIVRAKRTKGTARFELWGVNAESGVVNWQMNMQGAEPIDPPDEMAGLIDDTDLGWTWQLTDAGLVLLTFSGEPNQVVIETINPSDGTDLDKQTVALKKVGGDFYSIPSTINWQGTIVYMNIDSDLYSIDVSTTKIQFIY